jgi:hypothetical protein
MKTFFIVLCFTILSFSPLFGFGIGVQGGGTIGSSIPGTNAMITFKPDDSNLIFGLGADFRKNIALGISADYWFRNDPLGDIVYWYLGVGIYGGLRTGNATQFAIAARLPIGVNMFLFENFLELYLEGAPAVGVGTQIPAFGIQIALGFRLWFPEYRGRPLRSLVSD